MNSQFQTQQTFPQNRSSPALAQQGNFQNIPLGPSKPGGSATNGPLQSQGNIPNSFPPQSGPFQPPPVSQYGPPPPAGMRAPPINRGFTGIPPNQLPPSSANLNQQGVPSLLNKNQMTGGGVGGVPSGNSQGFPAGNTIFKKYMWISKKYFRNCEVLILLSFILN